MDPIVGLSDRSDWLTHQFTWEKQVYIYYMYVCMCYVSQSGYPTVRRFDPWNTGLIMTFLFRRFFEPRVTTRSHVPRPTTFPKGLWKFKNSRIQESVRWTCKPVFEFWLRIQYKLFSRSSLIMASKITLSQALGTDGTDFSHRQKIATHYHIRWEILD